MKFNVKNSSNENLCGIFLPSQAVISFVSECFVTSRQDGKKRAHAGGNEQ